MTTRSATQVADYFRKARTFYPFLGIENSNIYKKRNECDALFLQKFGLSPSIKESWYRTGIKKIYWEILGLLEENQNLKKSQKINNNLH